MGSGFSLEETQIANLDAISPLCVLRRVGASRFDPSSSMLCVWVSWCDRRNLNSDVCHYS